MILTFAELRIQASDFNGMSYQQAVPLIINIAGDATQGFHKHAATNIETLYNWAKSRVNFTTQTVELVPIVWHEWMYINS